MEDKVNSFSDPINNTDVVQILQKQNQLLEAIQMGLLRITIRENLQQNSFRTNIVDIHMSISSMIIFMFKWFIASIPIGIVIAIMYGILYALFNW